MCMLFTRKKAAEKLGISVPSLDRLRRAGSIPAVHPTPHSVRFTEEALEEYIKKSSDAIVRKQDRVMEMECGYQPST